MHIGSIILFIWILLLAFAVVAGIVMVIVRGTTSLKWSVLTILGTILLCGFMSAAVGIGEDFWKFSSPGFLVAMTVGFAGVVLAVIGIRGLGRTIQRKPRNETKT
jgi:peptidoglycan/LPS O-acetylase OafA/YrhL